MSEYTLMMVSPIWVPPPHSAGGPSDNPNELIVIVTGCVFSSTALKSIHSFLCCSAELLEPGLHRAPGQIKASYKRNPQPNPLTMENKSFHTVPDWDVPHEFSLGGFCPTPTELLSSVVRQLPNSLFPVEAGVTERRITVGLVNC